MIIILIISAKVQYWAFHIQQYGEYCEGTMGIHIDFVKSMHRYNQIYNGIEVSWTEY